MVEKVKFVSITRTIDTRNGPQHGIHYLDAIDENGYHPESSIAKNETDFRGCYD